MKLSSNKLHRVSIFLFFMLLLSSSQILSAQEDIFNVLRKMGYSSSVIESVTKGTAVALKYEPSGTVKVPYSGKYLQIKLPSKSSGKYLYLEARGADGNKYELGSTSYSGGEGALIKATFKVGDGGIPVGAKVRFLVGGKGDYGSGGGGTGILYQANGSTDWNLLVVAGAGGGAGGTTGEPGEITTSGRKGRYYSNNNGGSDGSNGKEWSDSGKPGYGVLAAYDNGEPIGSKLGSSWGFGGGGSRKRTVRYALGGGGGGYSGGGGGKKSGNGGGGGGGGSYVNNMAVGKSAQENGYTESPVKGYVTFSFIDFPYLQGAYISSEADPSVVICKDGNVSSVDDGTKLYLRNRVSSDTYLGNKIWAYNYASKEIQMVANTAKCIDLNRQNTANGTKVQLWKCNQSTAQQWLIEDNMIKYAADPSKCLIWQTETNSDPRLVIYTCSAASDNQKKWTFHAKDAPIYITMKSTVDQSTKYVVAKDGEIDDVANKKILKVVQKHTNADDTPNQIWKYQSSDYSFSYDRVDSKCIDLQSRNTSNGTPIQLYDCNGTEAQQWIMSHNMIKYKANSSKCLIWSTQFNLGKADKQLVIWDCDDTSINDAQKLWTYQFE